VDETLSWQGNGSSIVIRRVAVPDETNWLDVVLTVGETTQGIQSPRGAVWEWLTDMTESPRWGEVARKGIELLGNLAWE